MSVNKKYYYLKLKENFFDSEEIILLEAMPDGIYYSNILLKLYLKSLKHEGKLIFKEKIPYNSEMLSVILRHPVGMIEKAIEIFKKLNLIEILESGEIYITDIQNFIGKGSTEAERKVIYRKKIEINKDLESMLGQDGDNVGTMSHNLSTRDRDRDRDRDRVIYDENDNCPNFDENEEETKNQIDKNILENWKIVFEELRENDTDARFTNREWEAIKMYALSDNHRRKPYDLIKADLMRLIDNAYKGLDIREALLQAMGYKALQTPKMFKMQDDKGKYMTLEQVQEIRHNALEKQLEDNNFYNPKI